MELLPKGKLPDGDEGTLVEAELLKAVKRRSSASKSDFEIEKPDGDFDPKKLARKRVRMSGNDRPEKPEKMPFVSKFGYGTGHVLNDLCASLWFSYLLFYLQNVVRLTHEASGSLLLLGQVVDGVSTPIIGYVQDRNFTCLYCKYGQCKSWHLMGCVFILLSFPFVFSPPIFGHDWGVWVKFGYYAPFIFIFQVGWAACQVSHLALLPKMTPSQLLRTELLAVRYGFTVGSNLTVFTVTWLILGIEGTAVIDETYAYKFRTIALIAVAIGLIFVILFHVLTHEQSSKDMFADLSPSQGEIVSRKLSELRSSYKRFTAGETVGEKYGISEGDYVPPPPKSDESVNGVRSCCPANILSTKFLSTKFHKRKLAIKDWMSLPQFYIVGLVYMATRMSVNLTQVYMPIYLHDSLRLENMTVATVPLAMYVSGFFMALVIKPLNKYLGSQLAFTCGVLLSVVGSFLILCFDWRTNAFLRTYGIYGVALLTGGGSSAILVTSLSITADLIGTHVGNSAFVYGVMSFTDKLSCGLAVMLINSVLLPIYKHNIVQFYQNVLAVCCGGSAILGLVGIIILTLILICERRNPKEFFDAEDEKKQRKLTNEVASTVNSEATFKKSSKESIEILKMTSFGIGQDIAHSSTSDGNKLHSFENTKDKNIQKSILKH